MAFHANPETIKRLSMQIHARQIESARDRIKRAMAIYNRDKVLRPGNAQIFLEIAQETAINYNLKMEG